MRSLIVAALFIGTALGLSANDKPVITKEFVDQLNAVEGKTWVASEDNGVVTGAKLNQIKSLLGTKEIATPQKDYPMREFTKEELEMAVPEEFDSAKNWPHCTTITHIWDQSDCGSDWAIATAGAISDRLCTTGSDRRVQFISARDMLSCCYGYGCKGGYPFSAWDDWTRGGFVTEECQPYPFPKCSHYSDGPYPPCGQSKYPTPECLKTCSGNATAVNSTRIRGYSRYGMYTESRYQLELITYGPFVVSFSLYTDFLTYKSGVYSHVSGALLGKHAARIVGWGVMNGVKYWKIANGWNENWGMEGYFLIRRGVDECGIESAGSAGVAQ